PSKCRSIIRESKSGRGKPPGRLAVEARSIPDPYYTSLALFGISSDRRLKPDEAKALAEETIELIPREEREWRRAELITEICKVARTHRNLDHTNFRQLIMKEILTLPHGKGKSDALIGSVKYLGCEYILKLLAAGLDNPGFEMVTAKPLIKHWAKYCNPIESAPLNDTLGHLQDGIMRVKLYGYLHLQMSRVGSDELTLLAKALEDAIELPADTRTEALRYLADQSSKIDELETIAEAMMRLDSPEEEARLFSTLAASADRAGHRELAVDWFTAGLEAADEIDELDQKINIKLNLAQGLTRLGESEMVDQAFATALADAVDDDILLARVKKAMGENSSSGDFPEKPDHLDHPTQPHKPRHVLGLYDTYEGGLKPVHIRMVARAAPLCIAYGLDLAIMGFPTKDLDDLVKKVLADTNIGKGGKYLKELSNADRILLVQCSQKHPPDKAAWKNIGLPIATTSRPHDNKAMCLDKALELAIKAHPRKTICLIMGLGKKGLPKSLLASVDHHVELTGSNIPLETATVMGIIAQKLGGLE
ncbi:MAG: DUF531 family protein, partial [Thermoplasmata archaeon]|nr:DUF531 family protein [Thermoplasmata archaeon]